MLIHWATITGTRLRSMSHYKMAVSELRSCYSSKTSISRIRRARPLFKAFEEFTWQLFEHSKMRGSELDLNVLNVRRTLKQIPTYSYVGL